jgi:hypothetical protein
MTEARDFEDLDIVIHPRNGRFLASLPQIGIYAIGNSIVEAVELAQQKKRDLVHDLIAMEQLHDFRIRVTREGRLARDQSLFDYRRALVFLGKVVVVLVAVIVGANLVSQKIRAVTSQTRIGGSQFWSNVEMQLAKAADPKSDLSADRKQKILSQIHTLVERWRPFFREASFLFVDVDKPPSDKP